jgi:DNA polymerase III subunit delta
VDGLQGDGEEPALVLWCIAEELRSLLQWRQDAGRDIRRLWRGGRRRQALLAQAAGRLPRARITELLTAAAHADLVVKGQRRGRAWDELARLAVAAAGAPLSVT